MNNPLRGEGQRRGGEEEKGRRGEGGEGGREDGREGDMQMNWPHLASTTALYIVPPH